ncbi:FitA-like ribbon-helix-helix domain-containing protein [Nocardia sp. NPDC052566]|uniref:FitA-like ribbon-helix-helix domain-containing protein n=1 Tax=Nocardia sp. NPDC052566 TaxID=3364330 RepID=UPI0037CB898A
MATIKTPKTPKARKATAKGAAVKATPTNLNVRNLDPAIKATIQRRANRHGRSMEAEVRDILTRAATEDDGPGPSPLSGAALLARLAELRQALAGEVPEIGVRHEDSK